MFQVQHPDVIAECVPIPGTEKPGFSPIYRNKRVFVQQGGELAHANANSPEARTLIDVLRGAAMKYENSPCYGQRVHNEDGSWGDFEYLSYREFYQNVIDFGKGLLELGLQRGDRVGIYSNNSIWWQTINFACSSVGMVVVPVYDSLGPRAAEYILNHAEVKVLFVNNHKLKFAEELLDKAEYLTTIALMDDYTPKINTNLVLTNCKEVLDKGRKSSNVNQFSKPDEVAVIMYTSGSTGTPKGCVLLHSNIIAGAGSFNALGTGISTDDVFLSFLPLAHIYAMVVEVIALNQGAKIGCARGPVKDLIDDIKLLRPTVMVAVPRILNRVVQVMRDQLAKKPAFVQKIVNWTLDLKIKAIKQNRAQSLLLDNILLKNFREALGGRMKLIVNGGAPIVDDIFDFFAAAVTPNVIQGYGLTETSAGVAVQEVPATNPKTVGACGLACEVRLRKVEGTNYTAEGEYPSGELLVRGPIVFQGYYKRPDLTKEVLDEEGWFATGDVVQITKEHHLQIIDRAKQLVKLSQGEYLSLTSLSELYGLAKGVAFMYVYASSRHDRPVALVVPDKESIEKWKSEGITDITTNKKVHDEIIANLAEVHKQQNMRGFEIISKVFITLDEPTVENGLLTPSMKPQFNAIKTKYEKDLLALYD